MRRLPQGRAPDTVQGSKVSCRGVTASLTAVCPRGARTGWRCDVPDGLGCPKPRTWALMPYCVRGDSRGCRVPTQHHASLHFELVEGPARDAMRHLRSNRDLNQQRAYARTHVNARLGVHAYEAVERSRCAERGEALARLRLKKNCRAEESRCVVCLRARPGSVNSVCLSMQRLADAIPHDRSWDCGVCDASLLRSARRAAQRWTRTDGDRDARAAFSAGLTVYGCSRSGPVASRAVVEAARAVCLSRTIADSAIGVRVK